MNNILFTWRDVFMSSLQSLSWGFMQFIPKLFIAIVLLIVGWVLANVVAKAFEHVFSALKVDSLFKSVRADELMSKMGMKLNTGYFVGQIIKWFIIILVLLPSLNMVGLDVIGSFLQTSVLGFLPRVIVGVFILIIATLLADALSKGALATAKSFNVRSANTIAVVVKYAIWIFAIMTVLDQFGIDMGFIKSFLMAVVYMVGVALALAFGLGGKDHASRFLSKLGEDMKHRD